MRYKSSHGKMESIKFGKQGAGHTYDGLKQGRGPVSYKGGDQMGQSTGLEHKGNMEKSGWGKQKSGNGFGSWSRGPGFGKQKG